MKALCSLCPLWLKYNYVRVHGGCVRDVYDTRSIVV